MHAGLIKMNGNEETYVCVCGARMRGLIKMNIYTWIRTEIVSDIKRCRRWPGLDVGTEIPAWGSADGMILAADASEKCRSENNDDDCLDSPRWPEFLHFSWNQTRKGKLRAK